MSRTARFAVLTVALCGCGYRSARVTPTEGTTYCLERTDDVVADPRVAAALEQAVRTTLSRAGALGSCERGRTLRVRLREVAFEPVGIVASPGGQVSDRGVRARVAAYAELDGDREGAAATPGKVTAEATSAWGTGGAPQQSLARQDAAASAAREAGEAIGRWLLGEPQTGTGGADP